MPSVHQAAPVQLDQLLLEVEVVDRTGPTAMTAVTAITADSRTVGPGSVFCCVRGARADGHDYAASAVAAGAEVVVCERPLDLADHVVQVVVADARAALAEVSAAFYGHPSRLLRVAGVTGTNGKTTVAHLLQAILEAHGWTTAVIGTIDGKRTTPEAPELQARLAHELAGARQAVAMEVSSHALDQRRVDAVDFAVVGFTNLSQDHLDYHGDMESYFQAKASLFEPRRAEVGVVNADDVSGRRLLDRGGMRLVPYSLGDAAALEMAGGRARFQWQGELVDLSLGGRFNVANALCAATMARELGVSPAVVATGLSSVTSIPGRFERIDVGRPFTVLVDYAHTPDALEQVLIAARLMAGHDRVVVVFGCGGERDRGKRPLMGEVATRLADLALLTSDNPRHEDALAIIDEVRAGVGAAFEASLIIQPDRRLAIEAAMAAAKPGDVVVVAGKGHETGQTIGDKTSPFDDRAVAKSAAAKSVSA